MKIGFATKYNFLKAKIETYSEFSNSVEIISVDDALKLKYDGLVFDDDSFTIDEILAIRAEKREEKLVMFVTEDTPSNIRRVAISQDIDIYDITLGQEGIVKFAQEVFLDIEISDYKNVIAVLGTHPQVGVTQTAFSLAKSFFETNRKACVIGLNFYNAGHLIGKGTDYSLDTIYPTLASALITEEKLMEYMVSVDGIHYLVGNKNYLTRHSYEIHPIKLLIDTAKSAFDYVILDLGSFPDTAGALAGLKYSDSKILVTTQQIHSAQNFNVWNELILSGLSYKPEDFLLIVNKYVSQSTLTPKQLSSELNVPLYGQLPFVPGAEDIEIEDHFLHSGFDKSYIKASAGIAKGIAKEKEAPSHNKKKKLFGIF